MEDRVATETTEDTGMVAGRVTTAITAVEATVAAEAPAHMLQSTAAVPRPRISFGKLQQHSPTGSTVDPTPRMQRSPSLADSQSGLLVDIAPREYVETLLPEDSLSDASTPGH